MARPATPKLPVNQTFISEVLQRVSNAKTKLASKVKKAKKAGNYKKQARVQNKINKRLGSKKKHTAASLKKTATKNKSWKKATTSAKKSGTSISKLVQQRKALKKGSAAYKKVQNQINKHYGVKKRH